MATRLEKSPARSPGSPFEKKEVHLLSEDLRRSQEGWNHAKKKAEKETKKK